MKRNSVWFFLIILLITLFTITLNLSEPFTINTGSLHYKFNGIPLTDYLSTLHIQRDFAFKKGLDLQGGTTITLRANMEGIPSSQRDDALNSVKTVIERRVNFFGVSEPVVQTAKVNNDYR